MKKKDYIARYGEAAYEKRLAQSSVWRRANKEEAKAYHKKYREDHQEQVQNAQHDFNRKGGKYYEKNIIAQRTGLQGDKNRIRKKHRNKYHPYKMIIAPDSQLHHEWIPRTSDYRGVALVEAEPHQYGIIDVIRILDGKITLLTEEEIKTIKKKVL